MKTRKLNQLVVFIQENALRKCVLIGAISLFVVFILFLGLKHTPTDCDKISATEVYVRIQNQLSQKVPMGTSAIKRKIVIKTGKRGYINGNKVCYAKYKNALYDEDMKWYNMVKSQSYVDSTGKKHYLFSDAFHPLKNTTVCYSYDKTTRMYYMVDGPDCCWADKIGRSRDGLGYASKTEDICWM